MNVKYAERARMTLNSSLVSLGPGGPHHSPRESEEQEQEQENKRAKEQENKRIREQ